MTDTPNPIKQTRENWDKETLKRYPEADPVVLQFITDLVCCSARTNEESEAVEQTFRAGYCWYFAHILKTAFGRGEVCWAAPFGHFVWLDTNGVPYDSEGVNDGEQTYHIPEQYLGDHIQDFMHVPGNTKEFATAEDLQRIIMQYETDNGLPHKDLSRYFRPW